MAKTILVVDDKREIRIMLDQYLSQEGFDVVEAADGQEALFVSRQTRPDLIILDLMMPNMGGYDFMRAYAKEADTPIILLTAKLEESDKVLGLELGADDYVTKPFSLRELTARVRAVLRRLEKQSTDGQRLLRVADITLDESRRQVAVNDCVVALTPSEFDLLALFLRYPGRVLRGPNCSTASRATPTKGMNAPLTFISATCAAKSSQTAATPATLRRSTASAIA